MPTDHLYHILCTNGGKVVYEGRFQCRTRGEALALLREKVGRRNLTGLVYTVTGFPIEVLKEVMLAISQNKKIPEGDIVPFDKNKLLDQTEKPYASVASNKLNPYKPQGIGGVKRRLGDP